MALGTSPTQNRTPPAADLHRGAPAEQVRGMFARIAPTYDLLNRVLSAGQDRLWRRRLAAELLPDARRVLDLCAGTGDLALEIRRQRPRAFVCAGDFCHEMLVQGIAKGIADRTAPATLDALHLPFADGVFDAATAAFGVRNFEQLADGLAEMCRVLRPGGQLAVLEFFRNDSRWRDLPFRFYFKQVLPRVGAAISRDPHAYTYLPASVGRFVSRAEFAALLQRAGFTQVRAHEMTLGIATLFLAHKPGP
jgi:demethylmenaquinone methyltransferase/2-methoxy-6-polyprenyl-1,4-benzoquinol methylase